MGPKPVDASNPIVVDRLRQDESEIGPAAGQLDAREAHSRDEGDARLQGMNPKLSASGDGRLHCSIDGNHTWGVWRQQLHQLGIAAGMPLVDVGKPARAAWTGPHRVHAPWWHTAAKSGHRSISHRHNS